MLICACEINLTRIIPSKHLIFNIFGLPALPASVLINQSRLIRPLVSSVPNNKGNCQWNTVPYNKDNKTTVSEIIKPIWVTRQPTQQQQCIYCEFVTYGELDFIAHVKSSTFFANYLAKNFILFILFSVTKLVRKFACMYSVSSPRHHHYSSLSESKFKTKLCTLPMHACNLTPGKKQSQIYNHWTNPSSCSIYIYIY